MVILASGSSWFSGAAVTYRPILMSSHRSGTVAVRGGTQRGGSPQAAFARKPERKVSAEPLSLPLGEVLSSPLLAQENPSVPWLVATLRQSLPVLM